MSEKHHYRAVFDSPYLSAADIVEPTIFTIAKVAQEPDHTKKTKDTFNTAYFRERELRPGEELKPMILNATNSRTMKKLTGSPYIEDWKDIAVTVYVDPSVRFGRDTVEGLRIATERPRLKKPDLTPENEKAWARAIEVYRKKASFDDIEKHMEVSPENKALIVTAASVPPPEEAKEDGLRTGDDGTCIGGA